MLLFTTSVGMLMAIVIIASVTWYDAAQIKKLRKLKLHPFSKQNKKRPPVTIMILFRGDSQALAECLAAITQTKYRKLEVIIIDRSQKKGALRRSFHKQPTSAIKRKLHIYGSKLPQTAAIQRAWRRYGNGEIVVVLNETSRLDADALTHSVRRFNDDQEGVDILKLRSVPIAELSLSGICFQYGTMLRQLSSKTRSVLRILPTQNIAETMYRSHAFEQMIGIHDHESGLKTAYGDDAILRYVPSARISEHTIDTLRNMFRKNSAPYANLHAPHPKPYAVYLYVFVVMTLFIALLCLPILIGYFMYIAVALHQPMLLLLAWIILLAILLFATWSDESLSMREKLFYSSLAPIAIGTALITGLRFMLVNSTRYMHIPRTIRLRYLPSPHLGD